MSSDNDKPTELSSILRIRRFRDYITLESETPPNPICGTSASLQSSECRNLLGSSSVSD
ncbi:hypothetical protein COLO4_23911 [Corchorus olitorius]|uniref:Uncharacterized protein n=1 Tax=Corchorus olitorius TaxID=93759 RepID=A0A1R3IE14_9ROSI|nr:hypothetical protein COLO4_23911 [Corchorus olitorius]